MDEELAFPVATMDGQAVARLGGWDWEPGVTGSETHPAMTCASRIFITIFASPLAHCSLLRVISSAEFNV